MSTRRTSRCTSILPIVRRSGRAYGQLSARIVATCFATRDQPHPRREFARVAKLASAPGNVAAGVRMLRTIGDVVVKDEPPFEVHSSTVEHLDKGRRPNLVRESSSSVSKLVITHRVFLDGIGDDQNPSKTF